MPILKVKNKETGQWEQVGVSTEATGAQIAAHNVATDSHADIRQAVTNAGAALSAHNVASDSHADIRQAISELSATTAAFADASMVYMTKVTLPTSGWNTGALKQTVSVPGILADDTKQLIQAVPAPASMAAATEAGVYCSGQGDGFLSFACESVPVESIVFNVSYQAATFVS